MIGKKGVSTKGEMTGNMKKNEPVQRQYNKKQTKTNIDSDKKFTMARNHEQKERLIRKAVV